MDIPASHVFDLDTLEQTAIERYVASLRSTPGENDHMAALDDERERARRQTVRGVHEWLDGKSTISSIATLTLPTGLGKTLTGLSAAFEARDLLAAQQPRRGDRPIVYALPYTSIIEQTRALFENPDLWGLDPQKSALTVHHYLSETVVRRDDHDQGDVDTTDAEAVATLLGESWRDGTVLTTFVQLFESLAGPSNRQGLKLSALESGLIILDEPQALPKDWWDGIERLLELLTEEYGARVIAMTATQPTLVRNLESVSLLEAGQAHDRDGCRFCDGRWADSPTFQPAPKSTYYAEAERVRYHIHESALAHEPDHEGGYVGHDTAAERLLETAHSSGSTLAVCNTIGSSRTLTDLVASRPGVVHLGEKLSVALAELGADATTASVDPSTVADHVLEALPSSTGSQATRDAPSSRGEDGNGVLALTLNSRYRPFDRRVIISLADRLSTSDHPFVLVSTQAIEAGVDLSFQTVFRDLAPLDSIVQAAGRCNRSYEWGQNGGEVTVWTLADPDEETPASPESAPPAHYVYEQGATEGGLPGHLRLISGVLAGIGVVDDIADEVFSRSAVGRYFDALEKKSLSAGDLREGIEDAKGRWLARQSLIGGRETVDILVGQTDSERAAIDQLTERFSAGDPTAYDDLQAASGLRVSVPVDVIESAPSVSRLDAKERDDDGVNVFRYTGGGGLQYDLTEGGLQPDDDVGGRFTI
jgi:CRISPR-associated endonuclease/helicase Cas3/CRISPR-associated endonuclease Cas3-HD